MKKNLLFLACFFVFFFTQAQVSNGENGMDQVVEAIAKEVAVNVFPNPVTDRLTITSQSVINSYKLYNILGSLVLEGNGNAKRSIIDVTDLHSGAYLLEVHTGTSKTTMKIIKR